MRFTNACLNVLLFIPFGFFLPTLWKKFRSVKSTFTAGLLITLTMEISQPFISELLWKMILS
ncbi:VanZ family protein [Candidatus Merdisoma sp. HCP28S3_D10]|uniref:VanZ family protein n=1 Tax=unclassified Candidatus Merdisoma TaxID=3099611 RepID=UPI003F887427